MDVVARGPAEGMQQRLRAADYVVPGQTAGEGEEEEEPGEEREGRRRAGREEQRGCACCSHDPT